MSMTVDIHDVSERLLEMVRAMGPGDELVLLENEIPVARVVLASKDPDQPTRPAPGFMRGEILHMASDFDEPLEDLKDYMG